MPELAVVPTPVGYLSFSAATQKCGYQLWFYRLEKDHEFGKHLGRKHHLCRLCLQAPEAPQAVALVYGNAVHAAIERLAQDGDLETAMRFGHADLDERHRETFQVWTESGEPAGRPIRWDDQPRLTKHRRPYRGDEGRVPDLATGHRFLDQQVPAWERRFRGLRASAAEEHVQVPLWGPLEGWLLTCYLDLPTSEGGLVDLKTSKERWKNEQIDEKLDQAHLYQLAYRHRYGHLPEYFAFHVGVRGSTDWQVIDVPFDPVAADRMLEHTLMPAARTIETESYQPNRSGYWHSERYCDWWGICPLGKAARGASQEVS